MMRSLLSLAVFLSAALLAFAEQEENQAAKKSDSPAPETNLAGRWTVEGLTLTHSKDNKETFTEKGEQGICASISDKSMTLMVGNQKFTELTYKLDPHQKPAAIDAKCDDRELLGIYEIQGKALFLRFNDAKRGRPKSLDDKEVGISIDLTRAESLAILYLNSDGSESAYLEPLIEYTAYGSPRWSRDGNKIVFDAWRSWCGESANLSHVFVANPDGTAIKDLGLGALPSVSPNGKQITFCQYAPNRGIWVMNIDGSEKTLIDSEGWCPDWTTNNEEVVYTVYNDGGANLRVCNTKTRKFRHLFKESKYQQIYWGLSCSSDGKWVCFRGILPDGENQLAIVSTEGEDKGFKVLLPNDAAKDVTYFDHYVNWTPDNKRVTALLRTKDQPNIQLYYLDLEGKVAPERLAGQHPDYQYYCSSWSPDGKKLVTAGGPTTSPVKPNKSEKIDTPASESNLAGRWNIEGLTLTYAKGEKEIFTEKGERGIFAAITEKSITLSVGNKMFAEISYSLDPRQTPAAIDAIYNGRELLGIYEIQNNALFLRFNDAKSGRPKSLDDKDVGVSMDLTRLQNDAILLLNADGSESECLEPMVEYSSCGSPRWSRDGSKIVLDAWRSWCGESARDCHVIIANPDGSEMKDLGLGALPSVSPNGKQVAFCQYSPDSGIWVMNIDGSERKLIDAEGWCPDWTTNSEEVVYTVYINGVANLRVCNIKTGKFRHLFKTGKYQQIFWGLSCSSDGKWVCYRGTLPNGESQLAIVSTEGEEKGFKVLLPNDAAKEVTYFDNYVNWTPDNKRVTALLGTKDRPEIQLYYLDFEGKVAPEWLSGQKPSSQRYCCSWSPDGKKILTAGKPSKPPVKPEKSEKENPPTP